MAVTKVPEALVQKLWAKKLFIDAQVEEYFQTHGFIGEGPNFLIEKKTELSKDQGDQITFGLTMKLSGDGVDDDATLEGFEEEIEAYDFPITVHQKRHAVRLKGKMEEQKAAYKMRSDAKEKLKTWLTEYLERERFRILGTNPTAGRTFLTSADHATVGTLDDTDLLTTEYISTVKRKALLAQPKIRAVRIKGDTHYVMVVHPFVARDLKKDEKWVNAQKDANLRGETNPLFSGALGIWDGVVLHEHELVRRTTDGGGGAHVAWNLFMGCQAGVWAVAQEPFWREKLFDYDNQTGFATGLIHGFAKTKFNNEDYGLITVVSSAAGD